MAAVRISCDLVLDARASLGEGPTWDDARAQLIWVDIDAGVVHRLDPAAGRTEATDLGQPVGAAVPRRAGGLALALRDGFALLDDLATGPRIVAPVRHREPGMRMNDGACDRAGRFWAGTLAASGRAVAGLYRWHAGTAPVTALSGVTISNGIGWSPDDRRMYYVDTPTARVDVFDFDLDAGGIARRRCAVAVAPSQGRPDGLAVDADGGIWVALWGGAAVHRYSPDGALDRRVELPVTQVTSCCFGDRDLGTLYVTSAARGVNEPYAGAIFASRPGCSGQPTPAFGG